MFSAKILIHKMMTGSKLILLRRNAAKPGQGRERMRGQFAGYIPANRAEKFREAERS